MQNAVYYIQLLTVCNYSLCVMLKVIRVPNTDGQGQSRHRRFKFLLADMTGDSTGAVEVACQEKR